LDLRARVRAGISLHALANVVFAVIALVATHEPVPTLAARFEPLVQGDAVIVSLDHAVAPRVAVRDRFDRLAMCESTTDPAAVSPDGLYFGAFQFRLDTWRAAGGSGNPTAHSYAAQKQIAMTWAKVVDPATQWPVCWPRTRNPSSR